MKYFIEAFKRYLDFKGRSTRSEYWYFILFYYIFLALIFVVFSHYGIGFIDFMGEQYNIWVMIYFIVLFIPTLSITVRRVHDVGLSGWWLIGFYLVPIFGKIAQLFFTLQDSQSVENKYGSNPKEVLVNNEPQATEV